MAAALVIDDDWGIRETVRILLEHQGLTVIKAESGAIGLRRFFQQPTDLVITDLVMPGTSGFEVIQQVRRHSPPTRIVAMSGCRIGQDLLGMAQDLGATGVVRKPFRRVELLAAAGLVAADAPRSTYAFENALLH
ncbi:MAG TPA: response regulator [Microvirga sp.]|jgi:CheY-like chemotaxis protein|nr:response regulator [Microvirga sp.]